MGDIMYLKSVLLSKAVIISVIIVCLLVSSVYFVGRWYIGINLPMVTDSEHKSIPRDAAIPTVQSIPPPKTDAPVTANTHETVPEETDAVSIDETESIDTADTFFPLDTSEEGTAEVPVSPYGFGPYPEVPVGFPDHLSPVWTWPEEKLEKIVGRQKDFELMHRVLIKLWNQGNQDFVAVTRSDDNGKVYPIYPNVAYVTWHESKDLYGKVRYRYPSPLLSGPNVPSLTIEDFSKGRGFPPHVTVLDRETAGIDPYQFLGLQRR